MDPISWLNANAGAVQGVASVVLVAITAYYAWTTKTIASETRTMAQATDLMVADGQSQRLDATLPILAFKALRWRPSNPDEARQPASDIPSASHFAFDLVNVGMGPALDVCLTVAETEVPYVRRYDTRADEPEPLVVPTGAGVEIAYRRSEAGDLTRQEWETLGQTRNAGVLTTTYRDIHGREFRSKAELRCTEEVFADYALELGPLVIVRPNTPQAGATVGDTDVRYVARSTMNRLVILAIVSLMATCILTVFALGGGHAIAGTVPATVLWLQDFQWTSLLLALLAIAGGILGNSVSALVGLRERMALGYELANGEKWPPGAEGELVGERTLTGVFEGAVLGAVVAFLVCVALLGGFLKIEQQSGGRMEAYAWAFLAVMTGVVAKPLLVRLKEIFNAILGASR